MDGKLEHGQDRATFYDTMERASLQPLWVETGKFVPRQPSPRMVPALWRHATVRPLLDRAAALLQPGEADRRVLVLRNPALPPFAGTTGTLYACLQLLLPGERAPAHRHTQNAFRFVLSGTGAYTVVDGQKLAMTPGDFILTPGWSWHSHGHDGEAPVVWLDGLDNAIVNLFDSSFFESGSAGGFESGSAGGFESGSVGGFESGSAGGVEAGPETSGGAATAPTYVFPFVRMRALLETMRRAGEIDPAQGAVLRYGEPRTGGPALSTIAAFLHLLPRGFATQPCRSTDATVYVVVEGRGRSRLGDRNYAWGPQDIFTVPSWVPRQHFIDEEAILLSFSDRAAQEKLSLWREQRGTLDA